MCLGIPGKIIEVYDTGSLRLGKIDYGGVVKEACLSYIPEAQVGQYAIIHVGFAISVLDEEEALESLKTLKELGDFERELGIENGAGLQT